MDKPKPDDPAQNQWFRGLAAELGTEDDEKAVEQAVKRLAKQDRAKPEKLPAKRKGRP